MRKCLLQNVGHFVKVSVRWLFYSQDEAEEMFNKVTYWVREDDSALGLPKLSGRTKVNSLAPPMMMLCCVQQMTSVRKDLTEKYEDLVDWILEQILMHSKVKSIEEVVNETCILIWLKCHIFF